MVWCGLIACGAVRFGLGSDAVRLRSTIKKRKKKIAVSLRCLPVVSDRSEHRFEALVMQSYCRVVIVVCRWWLCE